MGDLPRCVNGAVVRLSLYGGKVRLGNDLVRVGDEPAVIRPPLPLAQVFVEIVKGHVDFAGPRSQVFNGAPRVLGHEHLYRGVAGQLLHHLTRAVHGIYAAEDACDEALARGIGKGAGELVRLLHGVEDLARNADYTRGQIGDGELAVRGAERIYAHVHETCLCKDPVRGHYRTGIDRGIDFRCRGKPELLKT